MKNILKGSLVIVGAAVLLAACAAPNYSEIMAMKPSTAFSRALKLEYATLMEEEIGEVDWGNAEMYAAKATAAGNNQQVVPEELAAHDRLPTNSLAGLESARYWLTSVLRDGARLRAPYDAGKAQAMFDCWVEEQEENHQPADIALCRHKFEKAMGSIEKTLYAPKPMVMAKHMKKPMVMAKPAPKKAMPAPIPGPFIVYFDFDSAKIAGDAEKVIIRAVRAAQTRTSGPITIRAHADRAGKNRYNAILSGKRAKAVIAALADWGISSSRIKTMAVGEEEPAIKTSDNERESLNRRVVITLK